MHRILSPDKLSMRRLRIPHRLDALKLLPLLDLLQLANIVQWLLLKVVPHGFYQAVCLRRIHTERLQNRSNERERHGFCQTADLEFPTESRLCVCGGEATKYDRQIFDSIIQDNTMKRVQPFVYFCLNCAALQNKWMSKKQWSGFWYSRTLMLVCCPLTSQRAVYSAQHNTSNTFNGYRWFTGSFTSNVFTSNRTRGMSEAFLAHFLDERQVTYSSSQPVHRTCRDRKKSRLQPGGRFTQRKTPVVWTKKEQKKNLPLLTEFIIAQSQNSSNNNVQAYRLKRIIGRRPEQLTGRIVTDVDWNHACYCSHSAFTPDAVLIKFMTAAATT